MEAIVPTLVVSTGADRRSVPINRVPFTIGRRTGSDLTLAYPGVSRHHADITVEGDDYFLVDQGSKFGTFVNGQQVQRHRLTRDDRISLGRHGSVSIVFDPTTTPVREFLSHVSEGAVRSSSAIEKLTLLLEAARRLNTQMALGEVLLTLLDTALRLTGTERGFVFLPGERGRLECAAGRSRHGEVLATATSISRSIVDEAARSGAKFVIDDTRGVPSPTDSVLAHELYTVICIPLRRRHRHAAPARPEAVVATDVLGVLYLDSHQPSQVLSSISEEILLSISTEAAALVENFQLAAAEERSREYQRELEVASRIQRRLMNIHIPQLPFITCDAQTLACRNVGGDFFDVVATRDGAAIVITDVSGKGLPAALLASVLQGMIYTHLLSGAPIEEIAAAANQYLWDRMGGEKFATLVLATLSPAGELRYMNCGHLKPLLVRDGLVTLLPESNFPIGLVERAEYASTSMPLRCGDRLVLVSDGVTEAENAAGEAFGDDRLIDVIRQHATCLPHVLSAVQDFSGGQPLADDCTVVELVYTSDLSHHDHRP